MYGSMRLHSYIFLWIQLECILCVSWGVEFILLFFRWPLSYTYSCWWSLRFCRCGCINVLDFLCYSVKLFVYSDTYTICFEREIKRTGMLRLGKTACSPLPLVFCKIWNPPVSASRVLRMQVHQPGCKPFCLYCIFFFTWFWEMIFPRLLGRWWQELQQIQMAKWE